MHHGIHWVYSERHGLISGKRGLFYGRMPLKLGAARLWSCIQMNAEQIIQSSDPGLGLVRLHPSCSVFAVVHNQNLIPSQCVQLCEPSQPNVLLEGTAGSCSVWKKHKRFVLWWKYSTVIKVFNRHVCSTDRSFQRTETGILCPLHIEVLGFLTCIKVLLDVISKLALRGIFEVFNLWSVWILGTNFTHLENFDSRQ